MTLTTQQLATLKTAIQAEPAVAAFLAAGDDGSIAAYYNGLSATTAWMTSVPPRTLDEGADYSAFDTLAAGKRDAWALFLQYAPRDLSKNKNRKVVTDVWGAATAASIAESILTAATRKATRAEELFGGNVGSTGTVSATKLAWEGTITGSDVAFALRG